MTLTYDYVYAHMPPIVEEANAHGTAIIDMARFAPRDLSIFVESLEIISRLERERHERRQQRKKQQPAARLQVRAMVHEQCNNGNNIACNTAGANNASLPAVDATEDEPVLHLEAKRVRATPTKLQPDSGDDDNYSSRQSSSSSSGRGSGETLNQPATGQWASDSEESGVFAVGEPPLLAALEGVNVTPIRPRSQVISRPKSRSARARFIDYVLQRERQDATAADAKDLTEQREDALNGTQQQQQTNERVNMRLQPKALLLGDGSATTLNRQAKQARRRGFICGAGSAEERFLDRALRYLTL